MISLLDGRVLVWPAALTPAECGELAQGIDWKNHGIIEMPQKAAEAGAFIRARMEGAPPLAWTSEITVSVSRVPWHLDAPRGATHKVCIYLSPGGAGTEFRERVDGPITAPPAPQGTICLFNILLEHRAAPLGPPLRRVLGLRARAG